MALTSDVAITALVFLSTLYVGFLLGSRPGKRDAAESKLQEPKEPDLQLDEQENDEQDAEDIADGDLAAVKAKWNEQCKLVLVVRGDLRLKPGDISTECSNATLACYKALVSKNPSLVRHWEVTGQAKIALRASSEEELLELEAVAKSLNLCARAVHNADLAKGSEADRTVLGIGPAPVELVNQVTGHLRLL